MLAVLFAFPFVSFVVTMYLQVLTNILSLDFASRIQKMHPRILRVITVLGLVSGFIFIH